MKKLIKSSQFKIIAIALSLTVIICALVSGSIAFFTDSKESTSVYTAGSVYIELSEAAVKNQGGDLIEDTEADRLLGGEINENGASVVNDYGAIFPGQKIHKDPTIKNIGNNSAWIAAKIIIEDGAGDIHKLFGYSDQNSDIDIESLITGGLLDEQVSVGDWNNISDVCYNENYAMIQISDSYSGRYEFYFIMLNPLEKGAEIELFDTFIVDSAFGNDEMLEFRELKITVQAFAVQTFGFDSCFEAMNSAFPEHFEKAEAASN